MGIFDNLKKISGNPYTFNLADTDNPYVVKEWIDTDCFILNAILSDGDIFRGLPLGKRIQFAGESSTAKSLFTAYIVKAFLEKKENSRVVFFETEGSSISDMAIQLGIDRSKIMILPVSSVEEFKNQVIRILESMMETKERENFMFVVDSLGMLGSMKELNDALEGSDKADMTRAKQIKSSFRLATLKLTLTQTPMIIVNHTYADTKPSFVPQQIVGGGSGPQYSSDITLIFSKAQDKDETTKQQTGIRITAKVDKSRFMRENVKVKIKFGFATGLDKYSSLIDIAIANKMLYFKGNEFMIPGEANTIPYETFMSDLPKFFNEERLKLLQQLIKADFGFGALDRPVIEEKEMKIDVRAMSPLQLVTKAIALGVLPKQGRSVMMLNGERLKVKDVTANAAQYVTEELYQKVEEAINGPKVDQNVEMNPTAETEDVEIPASTEEEPADAQS